MQRIIIITALPFRKQGNQSMMRFVKLFLSKDIVVTLYTSGTDKRGQNTLVHPSFDYKTLPSFRDAFYKILRAFTRKLPYRQNPQAEQPNRGNYFTSIRTTDIFPPYGLHTTTTLLNKWLFFLLTLIDNLMAVILFLFFERKKIRQADVIVGYESGYTFAARLLSWFYGNVYVNKFQGVVPLKACGKKLTDCARYYPLYYFGLNPSDLCLMVNDGTDGAFYAQSRGCKSIYFEPHGVAHEEYNQRDEAYDLSAYSGKFIIFNNASDTRLKRTDRIIRALINVDRQLRDKYVLITTYHAPDLPSLREYTILAGLEKNVVFLDRLNHRESNFILRNSHLTAMTNEVSNLGNPVLESIFYGIPVLTIADGSLDGFLTDGKDSFVIPLEIFDQKAAEVISRLIIDQAYYNSIREHLLQNNSVNTLQVQQQKEFYAIETIYRQKQAE